MGKPKTISKLTSSDFQGILTVVNDAAIAYKEHSAIGGKNLT